jgi:hypothetical protein
MARWRGVAPGVSPSQVLTDSPRYVTRRTPLDRAQRRLCRVGAAASFRRGSAERDRAPEQPSDGGSVPRTPLIYISYGITKSGSTLAFHLAKAILDMAGFGQNRLSDAATMPGRLINYVERIGESQMEAIGRETEALGYPIVIKTHAPPTPAVRAWIAAGRVQGHCVFRDPRDIALSLMDHGARSRARGKEAFAGIISLDDALREIRLQVVFFREWARCPGFLPLGYDDVAFDTQAAVVRICAQLGVDVDPAEVERVAKTERFTQFNKGIRSRHRREMASEDSARIRSEFQDLIGEFCDRDARAVMAAPSAVLRRP